MPKDAAHSSCRAMARASHSVPAGQPRLVLLVGSAIARIGLGVAFTAASAIAGPSPEYSRTRRIVGNLPIQRGLSKDNSHLQARPDGIAAKPLIFAMDRPSGGRVRSQRRTECHRNGRPTPVPHRSSESTRTPRGLHFKRENFTCFCGLQSSVPAPDDAVQCAPVPRWVCKPLWPTPKESSSPTRTLRPWRRPAPQCASARLLRRAPTSDSDRRTNVTVRHVPTFACIRCRPKFRTPITNSGGRTGRSRKCSDCRDDRCRSTRTQACRSWRMSSGSISERVAEHEIGVLEMGPPQSI